MNAEVSLPLEVETLRVLTFTGDDTAADAIERAARICGDEVLHVADAGQALMTAQSAHPHIAFVNVSLDAGAGVALIQTLATVAPGISVYAMASPQAFEAAAQSTALGAAGFILMPPNGDALQQALNDVRTRRGVEQKHAALEQELDDVRRRAELTERVLRLARESGHTDAAMAIAEAMSSMSGAREVALYASCDDVDAECVRIAATAAAQEYPAMGPLPEIVFAAKKRQAELTPLMAGRKQVGFVLIRGMKSETGIAPLTDVAAAVLALVDTRLGHGEGRIKDARGRVYSAAYFNDVAARMIGMARRHGRRVSVAALELDNEATAVDRAELERAVLSTVRETDTLASFHGDAYYLLMPETGALGAHVCRRRVLAQQASGQSGDDRGAPRRIAIGVATYPHDGIRLDRLLKIARRRADEDARSVVGELSLESMDLCDIVDTLVARPRLGSLLSPYPLDVPIPAVLALVEAACKDAQRGGAAQVFVLERKGLGLASAARHATAQTSVQLHAFEAERARNCGNAEAIVVVAEHGSWVCCGRVGRDRFTGIHSADTRLSDLLTARLLSAGEAHPKGGP